MFQNSSCMDPLCSYQAKELIGWFAGQTPRRAFFSLFLQGTYIRASKRNEQVETRCTSWSEAGQGSSPSRLCSKSAVLPVPRQQHL